MCGVTLTSDMEECLDLVQKPFGAASNHYYLGIFTWLKRKQKLSKEPELPDGGWASVLYRYGKKSLGS